MTNLIPSEDKWPSPSTENTAEISTFIGKEPDRSEKIDQMRRTLKENLIAKYSNKEGAAVKPRI
jgi:hypothetical protein